jgi:transposase
MKRTVVGVDFAKRVFQLHWIVADAGEVFDRLLRRMEFMEHLAIREDV